MFKKNAAEPAMLKKLMPGEFDRSAKGKSPAINNATSKSANKDQTAANKDKTEKPVVSEKELSSEEKLALIEIKPIEKKALEKAYRRLCRATTHKENGEESFISSKEREELKKTNKHDDNQMKEYFTAEDVAKVLAELQHNASKEEINLMIWVKNFKVLTK